MRHYTASQWQPDACYGEPPFPLNRTNHACCCSSAHAEADKQRKTRTQEMVNYYYDLATDFYECVRTPPLDRSHEDEALDRSTG